jgi:DNA-binding transcriptional LysR family regulator
MGSVNHSIPEVSAWRGRALAVVLAAALGAAFGDLLLTSLQRSLADGMNWVPIAVAAPLMYLASRHFLDPLSRGLRALLRLPAAPTEPETPSGRGLWALATGSAVMFVWLANVLGDYAQAHPVSVLMTIAVSCALVGGITLGWIVGARSAWPLSAILGGLAGFAINTIATIAVLSSAGIPVTAEVISASAASGVSVGLVGLAGGLVIDTGIARRPSLAATSAALAMFAVTAGIGAWLADTFTLAQLLPNVMLGLGWLLGLSSSPYADALLSRRRLPGL